MVHQQIETNGVCPLTHHFKQKNNQKPFSGHKSIKKQHEEQEH
jgi:hypothetical protein